MVEQEQQRKWTTQSVFKKMDAFSTPFPAFNVKGQTSVRTQVGGVMTMLIATVVIMYGAITFHRLVTKYNPNINDYYVDVVVGEKANLNDHNFRVAFTVEDYNKPRQIKDSEEYVRWVFRVFGIKDNVMFERLIPYHKCTEEDYEQFNPIERSQKKKLEDIKSDPNRDFFCFDWEDENPFEIYGSEVEDSYQRVEMLLLPCNQLGSELGKREGETISEKCNTSLEEQIKYIGQSQIQVLVNKERFMPLNYGDETVQRYSTIINTQFDANKPSWATLEVVKTEIDNDSNLIQNLMENDETEFLTLINTQPKTSAW